MLSQTAQCLLRKVLRGGGQAGAVCEGESPIGAEVTQFAADLEAINVPAPFAAQQLRAAVQLPRGRLAAGDLRGQVWSRCIVQQPLLREQQPHRFVAVASRCGFDSPGECVRFTRGHVRRRRLASGFRPSACCRLCRPRFVWVGGIRPEIEGIGAGPYLRFAQSLEYLGPATGRLLVLFHALAQGIHLGQVGNGRLTAVLGGEQEPAVRLAAVPGQPPSPVMGISHLVGALRVPFLCGREVPLDGQHPVARDAQPQVVNLAQGVHVFDRPGACHALVFGNAALGPGCGGLREAEKADHDACRQ
jgi:hypothetical protein